jgi:hypothetical protein
VGEVRVLLWLLELLVVQEQEQRAAPQHLRRLICLGEGVLGVVVLGLLLVRAQTLPTPWLSSGITRSSSC